MLVGRKQIVVRVLNLLSEKVPEYFDLENVEDDQDETQIDKKELSIEDKSNRITRTRGVQNSKKELLQPIDVDLECLVFIKRKPIDPEGFGGEKLCKECYESDRKQPGTLKIGPNNGLMQFNG